MIRGTCVKAKPVRQFNAFYPLSLMGEAVRLWRLRTSVTPLMIDLRYTHSFLGFCLTVFIGSAHAGDAVIVWPSGWQVEDLGAAQLSPSQSRQRAAKNDEVGNPVMVMELTQSRLEAGHQVNVEGVLLEMRKAVQVNFARSGFQSVCTRVRPTELGGVSALETSCTITQNGVHVMTQTLVAAATADTAWSLSYAGSADGYAATKDEALRIRDTLRLAEPQ